MDNPSNGIIELEKVLEALIDKEHGCPWDKEQTPTSLCDYIIEEVFELVDAIRKDSDADVREEMGDVLFLLLFIGRLYRDKGFTLYASAADTAAKMIRRHPHVFNGVHFESKSEQLQAWEAIKRAEKGKNSEGNPKGTFDSLPDALPPLLKAYRINSKSDRVKFTWEHDEDVEKQFHSEWQEWQTALQTGTKEEQEAEFGDMLFTLVELGRRKGIKANAALNGCNIRFLQRFTYMEALCNERGLDFPSLPLNEKNKLWDEAKKALDKK